ncbi:Spy/CpxP family protein refolding chaperone [Thiomicrorhabdus sp. Milos-T2]|uniref:Spy/CpxP family protein refolding chaperone n=1 Tax=Thiomicrorhabdus sp. Milos-T2 TaxID=90814 RepID=UPI000494BC9F|nr:Spy/CpxP family protein refolding chaperone [Thiomicrorhabdus sp. Milos-T2]
MKKIILAVSFSALSLTLLPTVSCADNHKMNHPGKPSAEFFKELNHASFMPNLMKTIKQHKKELKVTKEQMQALKKFHKTQSPNVQRMVKKLIEMEAEGKRMALENYPPEQVMQVGKMSLNMRFDLMMAKLKCRSFIKSVLTPKQYKKVLTSYK